MFRCPATERCCLSSAAWVIRPYEAQALIVIFHLQGVQDGCAVQDDSLAAGCYLCLH